MGSSTCCAVEDA